MRFSGLVIGLLFLCQTYANKEKCSRFSPQELWFADFKPTTTNTLTEIKTYFEVVFEKLDNNMLDLMPHIKEDRDKVSNLTHGYSILQEIVHNSLQQAEKLGEEFWLKLNEAHDRFLGNPAEETQAQLIEKFSELRQGYGSVQDHLDTACREVAFFVNGLVHEAMEGVVLTLESELEESPENDGETAKLMQKKISEMAPGNFVGFILSRIIGRGLAPGKYRNSEPILFKNVIGRIDKMVEDFGEALRNGGHLSPEVLENYWHKQVAKSVEETKDLAQLSMKNYRKMFDNEVYVAELMMNLLAYY